MRIGSLLSVCVTGWMSATVAAPVETSLRPAARPIQEVQVSQAQTEAFATWRIGFRQRALAAGISADVFDRALKGVTPDPKVIERDRNQSEFTKTIWEYLDTATSELRVTNGKAAFAKHLDTLANIERRYGVPAEIVAAIWGLESAYGTFRGTDSTIRSLATLAHDARRSAFFEAQLLDALRILQSGDTTPAQMTGSWAGAMGHTQFMPTTYRDFAVDFDGDGRADIWLSITDALASTAHYIQKCGWQKGQIWGLEISLPDDFDFSRFADGQSRHLSEWRTLNLRPADNVWPVSNDGTVCKLELPAGASGPAFLITANFDAILKYNASVPYALAVVHLADRIAGKNYFLTPWPDEIPLSIQERRELQRCLVTLGYDTGGIDGILGRASRSAIRHYQIAKGVTADGYPSRALLAHMRHTC